MGIPKKTSNIQFDIIFAWCLFHSSVEDFESLSDKSTGQTFLKQDFWDRKFLRLKPTKIPEKLFFTVYLVYIGLSPLPVTVANEGL